MNLPPPVLSAENLVKRYGTLDAIKGIDFAIRDSGVHAILGQNGAGKSSLIKCALGLERITSGEMTLLGYKPGQLEAKRLTGVMLQDSDLPDLLTVEEQIQLFASYYPTPFSLEKTIALCGLEDIAKRRYKKLSGGQKRRAQFALAIVGNPKLIFLDEPTTGLDIEARRNMWSIIRNFSEQGKSIVLTTHYLEEAEALADNIMIMNSGTIVANATPAEIQQRATGSIIRCQTTCSEQTLLQLPGVVSVSVAGRFSEIRCNQVNQVLLDLLTQDPKLTELSVSQPKLEDIFSQLSQAGK